MLGNSAPPPTGTAGNASGQNDGAAACVVTYPERAAELGLRPPGPPGQPGGMHVRPETMGIGLFPPPPGPWPALG